MSFIVSSLRVSVLSVCRFFCLFGSGESCLVYFFLSFLFHFYSKPRSGSARSVMDKVRWSDVRIYDTSIAMRWGGEGHLSMVGQGRVRNCYCLYQGSLFVAVGAPGIDRRIWLNLTGIILYNLYTCFFCIFFSISFQLFSLLPTPYQISLCFVLILVPVLVSQGW